MAKAKIATARPTVAKPTPVTKASIAEALSGPKAAAKAPRKIAPKTIAPPLFEVRFLNKDGAPVLSAARHATDVFSAIDGCSYLARDVDTKLHGTITSVIAMRMG